jgi:hypothetical protein
MMNIVDKLLFLLVLFFNRVGQQAIKTGAGVCKNHTPAPCYRPFSEGTKRRKPLISSAFNRDLEECMKKIYRE